MSKDQNGSFRATARNRSRKKCSQRTTKSTTLLVQSCKSSVLSIALLASHPNEPFMYSCGVLGNEQLVGRCNSLITMTSDVKQYGMRCSGLRHRAQAKQGAVVERIVEIRSCDTPFSRPIPARLSRVHGLRYCKLVAVYDRT